MTIEKVKNIGQVGNYTIDGFKCTCDKCGITETVPQKGIGNVMTSLPSNWLYVQQLEFKIQSHYCRMCGLEIGIGC